MKPGTLWALVAVAVCGGVAGAAATRPTADAVLRELRAGNDHHVAKRYQHPHQTDARQRELVATQSPHAIVLSCADSRVAPEIILDQGLGDLFDVRVAGNVATDAELASIEYAASHLHTPLLVVMGHQKCGAVTAAAEPEGAEGHLPALLALIRPAVERARGEPGDLIENAVRDNVENVVRQIRGSSPVLKPLVDRGTLTVVGAVYSLDSGKVTWLSDTARSTQAPADGSAAGLAGTSWQLVKFESSDDTTLTPKAGAKYTIEFREGGQLTAQIDCNRGSGTWTSTGPNQITFGPMALTRMQCPPGSLHDQIVKQWGNIRSYVIRDGHLFLALMMDGGIYEFEPVARSR